jgi:hypothetical protein
LIAHTDPCFRPQFFCFRPQFFLGLILVVRALTCTSNRYLYSPREHSKLPGSTYSLYSEEDRVQCDPLNKGGPAQ